MLTPKQLPEIKTKDSSLYNLLRELIESVNRVCFFMGVDARPAPQVETERALLSPAQPAGIAVTASGGFAFVVITPDITHNDLTEYVVEMSTTSDFQSYTRYFLGNARQGLFPFSGTTYWRSAAKRPMSPLSNYTVFSP